MRSDYKTARMLARLALSEKFDKAGEPLFAHAERMAAHAETYGEATVAFLHDILEDTDCTEEELRDVFTDVVVDAVVVLTRRQEETYQQYIERVAEDEAIFARPVKVLDVEDHLSNNLESIPESLIQRYRKALATLQDAYLIDGLAKTKGAIR